MVQRSARTFGVRESSGNRSIISFASSARWVMLLWRAARYFLTYSGSERLEASSVGGVAASNSLKIVSASRPAAGAAAAAGLSSAWRVVIERNASRRDAASMDRVMGLQS